MRNLVLLFVALLLLSGPLRGQSNSPSYSLQQLLDRASLSTSIAVAKLNVEKARQVMLASRSDRVPDVSAGPLATYLHRSPTVLNAEGPEPFISGPGGGVEGLIDTKLPDLPRLNRIVRRNTMDIDSAGLDEALAERDVTYNVMSSFYNVLFDEESLALSKASQNAAREHLQESEQLYEDGKIAKYVVMKAQVRLANTEPQIIRNERLLRQDQETLAHLANLDVLQSFHLTGSLEQPMETFDFETLRRYANANRLDLKKMILSKRTQDETVKINGARDATTLQATGDYVNYVPNAGSTESSLSTYSFTLRLNVPLVGASHVHVRRQAEVQDQIISLQIKDLQTQIATDLAQKLAKLNESRNIMEAQKVNVSSATESLRVGELSYSNGKATSLDVDEDRQALLQAQTDLLQAVHDYAVGLLDIRRAAGLALNP